MKKRSFSVALSAVSCALASVFMIVGQTVPFAFATAYLFAAIALMLPPAKDLRLGGFLAYVATSLICLPFGLREFYKYLPFIAFFGLHPLANYLQRRHRLNRWAAFAVKAVWFTGVLCASWALFTATTVSSNELTEKLGGWIYLAIVAGGAVFFLLYDWLMLRCQRTDIAFVSKIDRGGRARRDPPRAENRAEDVFGEDRGLGTPEGESGENRENKKEESEKDGSNDGQ